MVGHVGRAACPLHGTDGYRLGTSQWAERIHVSYGRRARQSQRAIDLHARDRQRGQLFPECHAFGWRTGLDFRSATRGWPTIRGCAAASELDAERDRDIRRCEIAAGLHGYGTDQRANSIYIPCRCHVALSRATRGSPFGAAAGNPHGGGTRHLHDQPAGYWPGIHLRGSRTGPTDPG